VSFGYDCLGSNAQGRALSKIPGSPDSLNYYEKNYNYLVVRGETVSGLDFLGRLDMTTWCTHNLMQTREGVGENLEC